MHLKLRMHIPECFRLLVLLTLYIHPGNTESSTENDYFLAFSKNLSTATTSISLDQEPVITTGTDEDFKGTEGLKDFNITNTESPNRMCDFIKVCYNSKDAIVNTSTKGDKFYEVKVYVNQKLIECTFAFPNEFFSTGDESCRCVPGITQASKSEHFLAGSSMTREVILICIGLILCITLLKVFTLYKRRNPWYTRPSKFYEDELPNANVGLKSVLEEIGLSTTYDGPLEVYFPEFVEKRMNQHKGIKFRKEFKKIERKSPNYPCTEGEKIENQKKNCFDNILPYDHSRVVLTTAYGDEESDYINASYIPGYYNGKEYIVTQLPLADTVNDFWRMVWEQNADMIIMITCTETLTPSDIYWPGENEELHCDDLIVTMISKSFLNFTIRTFRLVKGFEYKETIHMHFMNDIELPVDADVADFVNFIRAVRERKTENESPIIVHSRAGVGRPGIFVALDILIQCLNFSREIDVYSVVLYIRKYRMMMVINEEQYLFLYKCLVYVVRKRKEMCVPYKTYLKVSNKRDDQLYNNMCGIDSNGSSVV